MTVWCLIKIGKFRFWSVCVQCLVWDLGWWAERSQWLTSCLMLWVRVLWVSTEIHNITSFPQVNILWCVCERERILNTLFFTSLLFCDRVFFFFPPLCSLYDSGYNPAAHVLGHRLLRVVWASEMVVTRSRGVQSPVRVMLGKNLTHTLIQCDICVKAQDLLHIIFRSRRLRTRSTKAVWSPPTCSCVWWPAGRSPALAVLWGTSGFVSPAGTKTSSWSITGPDNGFSLCTDWSSSSSWVFKS